MQQWPDSFGKWGVFIVLIEWNYGPTAFYSIDNLIFFRVEELLCNLYWTKIMCIVAESKRNQQQLMQVNALTLGASGQ